MDCYDCEHAIFDYEEYYGGYREKIVAGCKINNDPDLCGEWCDTCKHVDEDYTAEPCVSCNHNSNYEVYEGSD